MKSSGNHGTPITPEKETTSVPITRTLGVLSGNLTTLPATTTPRFPIRNPILKPNLKIPMSLTCWARMANSRGPNGNVVSKRGYASTVENQDTSPPTASRQPRPEHGPPSSSRRSPRFQQTKIREQLHGPRFALTLLLLQNPPNSTHPLLD